MTSEGDHRRTLGLPSRPKTSPTAPTRSRPPPATLAQAGARLIRARSAGEDTSDTLWVGRSRDSVYESSWALGGTTAYQSPRAAPPGTSCRDTVLQVRVSVLQVYTGAFSPQHCFDDAGFWPQGGRGYRTPAGVCAEAGDTEGQGNTSVKQCQVAGTAAREPLTPRAACGGADRHLRGSGFLQEGG